jgi:pyruvate,water dikinase
MNSILWFNKIKKTDINLVGGKNLSLGDMYNNLLDKGVDIPNGFAITTIFFQKFIKNNNITDIITKLVLTKSEDLKEISKLSQELKTKINNGKFNSSEELELHTHFNELMKESQSIAVRSTSEDLDEHSFAGQHDSYLNINNYVDFLISIKKVFASLFNERAIHYRNKINKKLNFDMAVVVQKMVFTENSSSGVLFTVDVNNGDSDYIYIASTFGACEIIVQGLIIPDEFIIKKNKSLITNKELGNKNKKIIYNGTEEKIVDTSEYENDEFSLTDVEIVFLSNIAITIENFYEKTMDIEWSKCELTKKIYIVQARPTTTFN